MKIVLIVALAACMAVTYTSAAPRSTDWRAVKAKLSEIESLVFTCVANIRRTALGDRSASGPAVVVKLEIAATKAAVVFAGMNIRAAVRTLTEENASASIMKLATLGNNFYGSAEGDIAQLSAEAAATIQNLVSDTIAQMEQEGEALYALLN